MQINIETKFNIGQEVYIIQKARSKEPCAACNGEGHIMVHIDDKILYFNEEVAEMLQKEKIMNLMIMVMYSEDNMKIQNLYQKT